MRSFILLFLLLGSGITAASDIANAIVLQTVDEQHIGFTLFHPHIGSRNGDCVFVVVPKNPDLYKSSEVTTLLDIKEAGEHQWRWQGKDIIVYIGTKEILQYGSDGSLYYIPSSKKLGIWFPVPSK